LQRENQTKGCCRDSNSVKATPPFHIPRHDIPSSHHRELREAAMNLWLKIARS
jgi:hypothetical protein